MALRDLGRTRFTRYLAAVAGVAAVTAAIAVLRLWLDVPNLAVAYVLLVLLVGAAWGWPVAAVIAATPTTAAT